MQKLQINLQSSSFLRLFNLSLAILTTGILLACAFVAVIPWVLALICVIYIMALAWSFECRQARLTHSLAIVDITWHGIGEQWTLSLGNGESMVGQLCGNSVLLSSIILLNFKCCHRKYWQVIVTKDNVIA